MPSGDMSTCGMHVRTVLEAIFDSVGHAPLPQGSGFGVISTGMQLAMDPTSSYSTSITIASLATLSQVRVDGRRHQTFISIRDRCIARVPS